MFHDFALYRKLASSIKVAEILLKRGERVVEKDYLNLIKRFEHAAQSHIYTSARLLKPTFMSQYIPCNSILTLILDI